MSDNLVNSNNIVTFALQKFFDIMKTSELTKMLSAKGCYFLSHGGRHDNWYSPITGKTFQVPRHQSQEIPKGTQRQIEKRAGI